MSNDEELVRNCVSTMQQALALVERELDRDWRPSTVSAMVGHVQTVADRLRLFLDAWAAEDMEAQL